MSIITLTKPATEHIKKMLTQTEGGIGFRLSIKKTGCSGYAYVPDIIKIKNENDIAFSQDGLEIFIDRNSETFLKNVIVDYVAYTIGLKQKRLVFINPNEKNRCGCGESFTVD